MEIRTPLEQEVSTGAFPFLGTAGATAESLDSSSSCPWSSSPLQDTNVPQGGREVLGLHMVKPQLTFQISLPTHYSRLSEALPSLYNPASTWYTSLLATAIPIS